LIVRVRSLAASQGMFLKALTESVWHETVVQVLMLLHALARGDERPATAL